MRGWVLEEFGGPLVRRDVAVPAIGPGEVLVPVRQELQETMNPVGQGRLVPVVDRIVPFDDIESAFAALREKRSSGRNVLSIGP